MSYSNKVIRLAKRFYTEGEVRIQNGEWATAEAEEVRDAVALGMAWRKVGLTEIRRATGVQGDEIPDFVDYVECETAHGVTTVFRGICAEQEATSFLRKQAEGMTQGVRRFGVIVITSNGVTVSDWVRLTPSWCSSVRDHFLAYLRTGFRCGGLGVEAGRTMETALNLVAEEN